MKKLFVIPCILGIITLSGCSAEQWKSYQADYINSLYTNEREIASNNTYNLNDIQQEIDGQDYTGHIEFTGMDTLWKLNAEAESEVDILYSLSVDNGTAKLVLLNPYGGVEKLTESNESNDNCNLTSTTLKLKKGENIIKLVSKGDKTAEINLKFKASDGEVYKIGESK